MRACLLLMLLLPALSMADEKIWHVKAFHPDGKLLDVKAIDKQGNLHLLDIKALYGDQKLPVKVLLSNDKFEPVKAIGEDGAIFDIKALTAEGQKLDVKGVQRSGSIIHIKAIGDKGAFYGVKAISPEGRVYDIKGIKMSPTKEEGKINGVAFAAHIKALPPAPETGQRQGQNR